MNLPMRKSADEASETCGISIALIIQYIEQDWINPIDWEHGILDEEDIARIRLINELKDDFGVNDEALPIILHLLDQINLLHRKIREL